MRTVNLVAAGSAVFLGFIALAAPAPAEETKRPDVVMFVLDDMNDWIQLLDPNGPIRTPNLQRLTDQGMLFTRAYCASAACNPSRVSALTGLRPSTSGVYGNKADWRRALPDRKTIMQQFMDAGYHVAGAGKVFHHHYNGAFDDDASFHNFQPMRPQNMPPEKPMGPPGPDMKKPKGQSFTQQVPRRRTEPRSGNVLSIATDAPCTEK